MILDQGDKLYKLAEDIAANGLNPSEVPNSSETLKKSHKKELNDFLDRYAKAYNVIAKVKGNAIIKNKLNGRKNNIIACSNFTR